MPANRDPTGLPVLYSFRRCPYAIRARLAIAAAGTAVRLREVVLRDKPAELLAASPKATVPVLVLPDGRVIEQSLEIMRWALSQHDPGHWLRADDDATARRLVALNDGPFKQWLDGYKYASRGTAAQAGEHRDAAAALLLTELEPRLSGQAFVLGDLPSLADMAIAPFVRQFAGVDPVWFAAMPWPRMRAWLQRFTASGLFVAVMCRTPPWRPGDAEPVFGQRPADGH